MSFNSQFTQFNNLIGDSLLNPAQVKEQLQLHVQTIGILVAEKAELESTLKQTLKKCDKKQDECDELMGRLKASRQKISDLEKLVQQQQDLQMTQQPESNFENDRLRYDLGASQIIVDELRLRLTESNEKLNFKQQETHKLGQYILELKSQLELMGKEKIAFTKYNLESEFSKIQLDK